MDKRILTATAEFRDDGQVAYRVATHCDLRHDQLAGYAAELIKNLAEVSIETLNELAPEEAADGSL